MAQKNGWKIETVYGTTPLTGAADTVYSWGLDDFGFEFPYEVFDLTPIQHHGVLAAKDLVQGMKKVDYTHKTICCHAKPWAFALGKTSGGSFYLGNDNWSSFTHYFEIGDEAIQANGCYIADLDYYAMIGGPSWFDMRIKGQKTASATKITTAASPAMPAGLATSLAKGWQNIVNSGTIEYNDVDLRSCTTKVHVGVHNVLAPEEAFSSENVLGFERKACAIVVDFDVNFKGTANDFYAKFKAAFTPGATNDFEHQLTWGAYNHYLQVHNLQFNAFKLEVPPQKAAQIPNYHIAGIAFWDGTNEIIKVTPTDGVTY